MPFAVNALELLNSVEGHYSLKNEFERSATGIGANISEANYAQSNADFLVKANISEEPKAEKLLHDCGELCLMLVSSVTTLKSKFKHNERTLLANSKP